MHLAFEIFIHLALATIIVLALWGLKIAVDNEEKRRK